MPRKSNLKVTPSTGNVFRDSGFSADEAEHLLVRADLLIQLQKALASRGLTQAKAAKILRVTQPRVSDLLRGRIDLFSTDSLIDMLARLGVHVRFVRSPHAGVSPDAIISRRLVLRTISPPFLPTPAPQACPAIVMCPSTWMDV